MKRNAAENLYVVSLLLAGEKNAIKSEQLRDRAGYETVRELRKEIERERNSGAIILSSNRGYFLPERDETGQLSLQGYMDAKRWWRQQTAKGNGTLRSARSAGAAVANYAAANFSIFGEGRADGKTANV